MRRPWALPLVPLYAAAVAAKSALHVRGLFKTRSLANPVISVGSLSAGGAGKTPVVLMLAELLTREGIAVDILSRGYGRRSNLAEEVDPAGPASRFGDEPLEMACRGFPVYVAPQRFDAGSLAEFKGRRVHLLDDGFQHRQLTRALDLVLLTAEDAADTLLPAGNLREPLPALARADIVILREEEATSLTALVRRHSAAPVWLIRRQLSLPLDSPQRPFIFCGIARPANFLAMLDRAGYRPCGDRLFADHHHYTARDLEQIARQAQNLGADGFLTTAKDRARLTPGIIQTLEQVGPVRVATLTASLVDEAAAVAMLRSRTDTNADSLRE
jgi:tetraacyldisaccharide 4'-kinase